MTLILLTILKKFWLPIVIFITLMGALFYTYNKGKKDCQAKITLVLLQEQLKQQAELDELYDRIDLLRSKMKYKIEYTDKEASCILSGNPIKEQCL